MTSEEKRKADLDWLYGRDPSSKAASAASRQEPTVRHDSESGKGPQPRRQPAGTAKRDEPPAPRVRPRPSASPAAVSKTAGPAVPVRKAVRRHPFRWLFVVILLVVIAWIAYLVTVPIVVWNGVATVDATPTGIDGLPGDQPGTVILIVGSDSRADLSPAERAQLGGPDDSGRTDTMMLLVIPKSGPKTLVSLPRDSYVSIPGHGMNKLNSAYAFGGAPLLVATVELATGVHVDDYVEMDMEGFAGLVDAVGGVEVCLDAPMQDTYAQIDLPAGCQTLDGANALGYARMRYSDPLGDLGRVQRQRELIGKIADKAATPSSVLNPGRYWTLGHAVGAALTRDNTMSALTALRMGLAMVSLGGGKGLSITVPISNPGESTPVGSAVIWDDSGAQELFGAIAQGDTNGLQKFAS